jgi:hypothetical protein
MVADVGAHTRDVVARAVRMLGRLLAKRRVLRAAEHFNRGPLPLHPCGQVNLSRLN